MKGEKKKKILVLFVDSTFPSHLLHFISFEENFLLVWQMKCKQNQICERRSEQKAPQECICTFDKLYLYTKYKYIFNGYVVLVSNFLRWFFFGSTRFRAPNRCSCFLLLPFFPFSTLTNHLFIDFISFFSFLSLLILDVYFDRGYFSNVGGMNGDKTTTL